MNRQEQLHQLLVGLQREVPDVRGALLASRDGLAIATTMAPAEAGRVAAMAATVAALAGRVVDTIGLGRFEETEIQGDAGTFVVYDSGELAVLAVLAQRGATLGLVHLEARRVAHEVSLALRSYREEQRAAAVATGVGASTPAGPASPSPRPASMAPRPEPASAATPPGPLPAVGPRETEYQAASA